MFKQMISHLKFISSLAFAVAFFVGGFFIFNTEKAFAEGETYTITFNSDGGSAVDSITQEFGTSVVAPANPTKTGYSFGGWLPTVPTTMPAENTTLVAQWTANAVIFSSTGEGSLTATVDGVAIASGDLVLSGKTVVFTANVTTTPVLLWTVTYSDKWVEKTAGGFYSQETVSYTIGNSDTQGINVVVDFGYPATISPTTVEFNTANPKDITTNITFNNETNITGVYHTNTTSNDIYLPETDYDITGSILTIHKEYLSNLPSGTKITDGVLTVYIDFNKTMLHILSIEMKTYAVTPSAPSVTANDDANTITGLDLATMEYSLDNEVTWVNTANPDLSGNKTVLVRVAANGINPVSANTTLTFTTNPIAPPAPSVTRDDSANTVTGMATGMEYNYQGAGYVAYVAETFNLLDFTGEKTLLVRTAAFGETIASEVVTLTFTTNPVTPAIPNVTADDEENIIVGLDLTTMQYSLDNETSWTETANPDLSGNKTVWVRVKAEGANPESDVKILNFTTNQYTITFNSAGGSAVASITQDVGSAVAEPANPTRTGYTFSGWDKIFPLTIPSKNVTVNAVWTANPYTITFNSAGGSGVNSITQDYGTAVTAPADPTRTGYTFNGWTPAVPTIMPAASQTLTAGWTINQYTITFNSAGGTDVDSITKNYGTAVTAPANPTRTGYTFANWSQTVPTTMPAEDLTITASWNINQYTITFKSDDTNVVAPSTQNYGTAVTAPENPTKTGYTFSGWDAVIPTTMPANNVTINAIWTINQYTIAFKSDGANIIAPRAQNYGTAVSAPTNPTKVGYTFSGWDAVIPTTMPANNVTINAVWTINQYTIAFETAGGSTVASITQDYGTAVTAPTDPTKVGYTFAGWSQTIPTIMPAENKTITASWNVNKYTIAFETDGGNTVDPIYQDFGSEITAPMSPAKTGYRFTGWTPSIPATMGLSQTLTAGWAVNQYTITFNSAGGSAVASKTQDYGTAVTAPMAPSRTGYTFAGWSPAVPATMGISQTLTAQWTDIQAPVITLNGVTPMTIEFGSTYTDAGATAIDNEDTSVAIITTGSVNTSVAGNYTITYKAEDTAGNRATIISRRVTVAEQEQTIPSDSGSATLSGDTTQVLLIDEDQPVIIDIDSDTENPSIDVSALIDEGTGSGNIPQITINTDIADIVIPEGSISSNGVIWDGVIAAPTITTVTLPKISGQTRTLETAIEVGYTGAKLSFGEAVKITLPNQAGKRAGYTRTGTAFTEITTVCGLNTQAWANSNLLADGDCKIDVGTDLVIWTKHFTTFAAYTQTKNSSSVGGRVGPATPATKAIPTISPATPATPAVGIGQVLGAEKYNFTKLMKIKSKGLEVSELQKLLNAALYDCGIADGIFGPKTKAAVIKFQIANGLQGDGIIGPITRAVLNK